MTPLLLLLVGMVCLCAWCNLVGPQHMLISVHGGVLLLLLAAKLLHACCARGMQKSSTKNVLGCSRSKAAASSVGDHLQFRGQATASSTASKQVKNRSELSPSSTMRSPGETNS
jgi:hypothetical protein